MFHKFRKSPIVCLLISLARLLSGRLWLQKQYIGCSIKTEDGQVFTIFRSICQCPVQSNEQVVSFIVRFRFARLSHNANRVVSIIPMLLITGFPGFQSKMYAVNNENGYWQGMYQWQTQKHLEEYLKSFVYKMMNKRAIPETIHSSEFSKQLLVNYINNYKVDEFNKA